MGFRRLRSASKVALVAVALGLLHTPAPALAVIQARYVGSGGGFKMHITITGTSVTGTVTIGAGNIAAGIGGSLSGASLSLQASRGSAFSTATTNFPTATLSGGLGLKGSSVAVAAFPITFNGKTSVQGFTLSLVSASGVPTGGTSAVVTHPTAVAALQPLSIAGRATFGFTVVEVRATLQPTGPATYNAQGSISVNCARPAKQKNLTFGASVPTSGAQVPVSLSAAGAGDNPRGTASFKSNQLTLSLSGLPSLSITGLNITVK